ncbi:hypothetical protein PC129_g12922 [Phytophthora cactorum]|uniref:Uncharacterized protein n=1 Tax=Phytophthora cactorum TaxID=29920 RepID=A0A329T3V2_9STRA|nr:hypothetical protein Pcac1_g2542 [Phytophthora cactorum]KAG2813351.1 hypothetical protein PC112_g14767 [Phytophthora cactorum]KAG2826374.1 hypothetical protein PC111_g8989 [Phytophthora cactorum]KAG2893602.1 hypothetical protein PC114_g16176 [Phytophthora cactorum]KAG2920301.1 hypothetical protein PC115_g9867 [Phytophthora cactorum]
MEKPRSIDPVRVQSTFVEDEIGELRKYIVEMMHAEMELMESIKLNERNIAAANARIKQFKELIAQESTRYKMLKRELDGDATELKSLEEKQVVAEAKHREFRDAVAQRQSEVQVLRARFQQQRAAMLSLRCQILDATTNLDKLSSMNASVEKDTQNVAAALGECPEPTEQRTARQKLRAKIRYTQQFIVQMEEETSQLAEKRTKLEAEVLKCEQENHMLRESIFLKEKDAEVLFNRLRDDTLRVVKEKGKIEGKLKAKRRKFRLKTKNEISSLKRRISFITCELERSQMTNEDALSGIDALSSKRDGLEQRLSAQNEQLAVTESAITELHASIATFGQGEGGFDTTRRQEKLSAKRDDAEVAQKKLEDKLNLLKLLETDQTQLDATLKDVGAQVIAAKNTAERLDGEIASLVKDIEHQVAKSRSLSVSMNDAKKKSDDLQAQYQEQQRKNKNTAKTQTKLRRQKDALLKQEKELTSEIQEAEHLRRILGEGIKHGMEYVERLRETNALCDEKEKRIEFELRRQELSLQQQCAQEESKFQADVAAWDEKITRVERQLRSL